MATETLVENWSAACAFAPPPPPHFFTLSSVLVNLILTRSCIFFYFFLFQRFFVNLALIGLTSGHFWRPQKKKYFFFVLSHPPTWLLIWRITIAMPPLTSNKLPRLCCIIHSSLIIINRYISPCASGLPITVSLTYCWLNCHGSEHF